MSSTHHDSPMDTWLSVTELAAVEATTRRQVYWAIDHGLPHSRVSARIRVRRIDWHDWHRKHMRGDVVPDTIESNMRRRDDRRF